jgi:hypothetical protein
MTCGDACQAWFGQRRVFNGPFPICFCKCARAVTPSVLHRHRPQAEGVG